MADRELNQLQRKYLQTRYSVTNPDVTTLLVRYLAENPSALNDKTKVFKALETAARA